VASSSGSLFFAQNFGSLGAAPVKDWAFRACAIQGTQQLYVVGMWAWGNKLTVSTARGNSADYGYTMTAVGVPIAIFLWSVGLVLFFGLPDFYRQKPGAVPDFYTSVFRRKIIVWFLVATFIQNVFLSAPYGRNWSYLWASKHAPAWVIVIMLLIFFIVIWAAVLFYFGHLSTTHSWIIPIFAIGLGAPRWCQILWSCSNIGQYLPWAGSPVASAILGRGLWLWLGVLDSIQGIGFGMIILQTMARFHCSFALMAGQCIGAIATIVSLQTSPPIVIRPLLTPFLRSVEQMVSTAPGQDRLSRASRPISLAGFPSLGSGFVCCFSLESVSATSLSSARSSLRSLSSCNTREAWHQEAVLSRWESQHESARKMARASDWFWKPADRMMGLPYHA
jgi:hypothetical protein